MFEGLDEKTEFGKEFQDKEFTFTPGLAPLNNGSYGAVPRRIQEIQKRFMAEMNAHPDLWFRGKAYQYWTESVEAAAEFFNCDSQDLVFVENATTGVNTILKAYDFKEGDSILSTSLTYGAISLTCRDVAAKKKVIKSEVLDVKFPIVSEEDVLRQYEDFFKSHPQTRIAVIDHITSPSAVLLPVKKISQLCHKYGILVLVDGAHAPGQIPLDFKDLDVDFYTGNFHKWLFAPRGCAVLYVHRKHHDWVKPLVTSWNADGSLGEQFSKHGTCDQTSYMCAKYALEFFRKIGGLETHTSGMVWNDRPFQNFQLEILEWAIIPDLSRVEMAERTSSYTSRLSSEAQEYLVKIFQTEKLEIPKSMEAPNLRIVALPPIDETNGKLQLQDFFMDLWKKTQIQTACVEIQGRYYVRLSTAIYNYMDEYKRLGDAFLEHIKGINEDRTKKQKSR